MRSSLRGLVVGGILIGAVACEFPRPADVLDPSDAAMPRFTLTVIADGPGTVSSTPAGISCASDTCTAAFSSGQMVALSATPDADAVFANFAGACNGSQPTCDVSMTEDRTVTATFVPFACEPNTTTCSAQTLVECDGSGVAEVTTCLFGCHPSGARCYDLDPSNVGMRACLDAAAFEIDVTIPDGATIDTDTGAVTLAGGGTVFVASETIAAPPGGVDVRCFRVDDITIGDVTVVGQRALTIAAHGVITLSGNLSVSARGYNLPGPGHMPRGAACTAQPGTVPTGIASGGGGGGGFGGTGGRGGSGGSGASGGEGGAENGNAEIVPLRGGCDGGGSGAFSQGAGAAALLAGGGIVIQPSGGIAANGWGGGRPDIPSPWGGASGGAILLEAPFVDVSADGFLVANGGGGAGSMPGNPGAISTERSLGGPALTTGDSLRFGEGGLGGAIAPATFGGNISPGLGGGGGGAAGRIRVNAYRAFVAPPSTILSPIPSAGMPARR